MRRAHTKCQKEAGGGSHYCDEHDHKLTNSQYRDEANAPRSSFPATSVEAELNRQLAEERGKVAAYRDEVADLKAKSAELERMVVAHATKPIVEGEARAKRLRKESRTARWSRLCGEATEAGETFKTALEALRAEQEEFETWRDNLPENLQSGPTGEKLTEVCDIAIEQAVDSVADACLTVDEALNADLPRGFGRD